jgi:Flp pilus assembly protein TadD
VIFRAKESLYKKDAKRGHPVEFEVAYDVIVENQIVIPSGAPINGSVRQVVRTGKGPSKVLFDLEPVQTAAGEVVRLARAEVRMTSSQPGFGVGDAIGAGGETGALAPLVIPGFVILALFEKKVVFAEGTYGVAQVAQDVAFDPGKLEQLQTTPSEVLRGGMVFLSLFLKAAGLYPAPSSDAAEILHSFGDLEGAIQECQQALALQPDSPELHLEAAGLFQEKGDMTRAALESGAAAKLLLGRVQLNPREERPRIDLINALTDAGDLDSALSQANEAIQALPGRPYFHYLLGRVLVRKKEPDAAIAELQWALNEHKNHLSPANCELGRAFELKGDPNAAVREYRIAFRAQGGDQECRAAYERLQRQVKK